MPLDRTHAFADGLVYGPDARRRWFARADDTETRAARAWSQFRATTQLAPGCRLGPSAWCVNGHRDPARIRLGKNGICRGLLRVEYFGDGQITIGEDCYIGDDCLLSSSSCIEIGSGTMLAHGVQIFDNDSHPANPAERQRDYTAAVSAELQRAQIASAPVRIGSQVWFGFNVIILKGVTIGDASIIAAGSVVTKDVPSHTLAAGNPAVNVKSLANV